MWYLRLEWVTLAVFDSAVSLEIKRYVAHILDTKNLLSSQKLLSPNSLQIFESIIYDFLEIDPNE